MDIQLLSTKEAAEMLGVSTTTFRNWLTQSDMGTFTVRGQRVTIDYYQGGRQGRGRIKIEQREVERLLDLMRVYPKPLKSHLPPNPKPRYQHIKVQPGRPTD